MAMQRMWGLLVLLTGCGNVTASGADATVADAANPVDDAPITDIDASPGAGACNLSALFGMAVEVPGATDVSDATVSYDEHTLYYEGDDNSGVVRTSRRSRHDAFPLGQPVRDVPPAFFGPSANIEETVLFVHSGQGRLYRATRDSTDADYRQPADLDIAGAHAFVAPGALYFTAGSDLYRASLSGGVIGEPARLDSLATASPEAYVVASKDDVELAFMRSDELVTASRTPSGFAPVSVQMPGKVGAIRPAGFSEDRCRLYITIDGGSGAQLYVMTRP